MDEKEKKYNHSEASKYLGIAASSLYKLTSSKQIKYHKGGLKRSKNIFTKEDLDKYLASTAVEVMYDHN